MPLSKFGSNLAVSFKVKFFEETQGFSGGMLYAHGLHSKSRLKWRAPFKEELTAFKYNAKSGAYWLNNSERGHFHEMLIMKTWRGHFCERLTVKSWRGCFCEKLFMMLSQKDNLKVGVRKEYGEKVAVWGQSRVCDHGLGGKSVEYEGRVWALVWDGLWGQWTKSLNG